VTIPFLHPQKQSISILIGANMSDDLFADAETDLGHAKKIVDTNFGDDDDSWESLMDEKPKVIEPEKKVVKKEKKEEPKKIEPKKPEPKKTVKPKEGMMKELEKDMSEMSVTEELFSDSPVIRIDMMKPKTQKDFEQFGEIVSNKLLEFANIRQCSCVRSNTRGF
jgi:FtsZ-interacting cell division protein YlmF